MTIPQQLEARRRPERRDWPVFILCGHRSGSTLLRYLLDAHERLACPPESKFIAGLQLFLDYPQTMAGLGGLGLSKEDLYLELRLFIERVMRHYTRRVGKSRWVDKTPNYYRQTTLLERIFHEQVLYIVLVRHPFDCICSLEQFLAQSPRAADPEIARNTIEHGRGRYAWARYWLDVYGRLAAFAASIPERSVTIKYEDLVQRPHETLEPVFDFIGEAYDPRIVTRAFASKHSDRYADLRILDTKEIHTNAVGRWRCWPKPEIEVMWDTVGRTACRFGYTIDQTETAAGPSFVGASPPIS